MEASTASISISDVPPFHVPAKVYEGSAADRTRGTIRSYGDLANGAWALTQGSAAP
jgi:hypothetical protein